MSNFFLIFLINIYCRPLLKEGKNTELKDNLIEHFDFVVVSCEVWKHLYSWYSSDWTIVRFVRRDKTNKKSYFLDLYPEKGCKEAQGRDSEIFESDTESSK